MYVSELSSDPVANSPQLPKHRSYPNTDSLVHGTFRFPWYYNIVFESILLASHSKSKYRIGLIPLQHIPVNIFEMINLLLTVIFIPLIRQRIGLKPDCTETCDTLKLKCVVFEQLALIAYPCPKRRFGLAPIRYIAVTMS